MKIVLILTIYVFGFLLANIAKASADADSNALSQSFHTTPLGHTNFGYVTGDAGQAERFDEDQKAKLLACKQDPRHCYKEEQPAPKRSVKRNVIQKVLKLTE